MKHLIKRETLGAGQSTTVEWNHGQSVGVADLYVWLEEPGASDDDLANAFPWVQLRSFTLADREYLLGPVSMASLQDFAFSDDRGKTWGRGHSTGGIYSHGLPWEYRNVEDGNERHPRPDSAVMLASGGMSYRGPGPTLAIGLDNHGPYTLKIVTTFWIPDGEAVPGRVYFELPVGTEEDLLAQQLKRVLNRRRSTGG